MNKKIILFLLLIFSFTPSISQAVTAPPWWMVEQSWNSGSGTAIVGFKPPLIVDAYNNNHSVGGSLQQFYCSTEAADNYNSFEQATFTAPLTGAYTYSARVYDEAGEGPMLDIFVFVNGILREKAISYFSGTSPLSCSVSGCLWLAAGDTLSFYGSGYNSGIERISVLGVFQ